MTNIYTIGFTKKNAETFFNLLKENNIDIVLDIRLNNTSQLAGFAKYPDIKFFLNSILNIEYIHDKEFAPTEDILKRYKNKNITWNDYINEFNNLMDSRKIESYIEKNFFDCKNKNYCLLCSESSYEQCHRSLVANRFYKVFSNISIINL